MFWVLEAIASPQGGALLLLLLPTLTRLANECPECLCSAGVLTHVVQTFVLSDLLDVNSAPVIFPILEPLLLISSFRNELVRCGQDIGNKILALRSLAELHSPLFAAFLDSLSESNDLTVYDSIPSEFLDPLVDLLMTDPVHLPSGMIVDRPVIMRHLLEYSFDPFTRLPLNRSMLIPATRLKQKIDEWLQTTPRSRAFSTLLRSQSYD